MTYFVPENPHQGWDRSVIRKKIKPNEIVGTFLPNDVTVLKVDIKTFNVSDILLMKSTEYEKMKAGRNYDFIFSTTKTKYINYYYDEKIDIQQNLVVVVVDLYSNYNNVVYIYVDSQTKFHPVVLFVILFILALICNFIIIAAILLVCLKNQIKWRGVFLIFENWKSEDNKYLFTYKK
jgi:uncharacterized membrane protein YciS (DUF1049 family)